MICSTTKLGRQHGRCGLAAEPWPWKYEAAFRANEIDETVLPSLTAEDLQVLGVGIIGHRRKLLVPQHTDGGGVAISCSERARKAVSECARPRVDGLFGGRHNCSNRGRYAGAKSYCSFGHPSGRCRGLAPRDAGITC